VSRLPATARWIISVVAVFTFVSPFVADWNATHIYNPNWPPHAKFHNAQTMLLGLFLGHAALYFAWRRSADQRGTLIAALSFAAFYWITQTASIAFPGTRWLDPEFDKASSYVAGIIPGNLMADLVILPLLAFAAWSGFRALSRASG
jgi:hypothetical protein